MDSSAYIVMSLTVMGSKTNTMNHIREYNYPELFEIKTFCARGCESNVYDYEYSLDSLC